MPGLGVDLDHMTIRIENEELRKPRVRRAVPLEPHGMILRDAWVVPGSTQMRDHRIDVVDPNREVDVPRVNGLIGPQRPALPLHQMQLPIPDLEPRTRKIELRRSLDLGQAEYLAIESPRTLEIRDGQRDVVQGSNSRRHGENCRWGGAASERRTQCTTINDQPPCHRKERRVPCEPC